MSTSARRVAIASLKTDVAPVNDTALRARVVMHLQERGLPSVVVAVDSGGIKIAGFVSTEFEKRLLLHTVRRISGETRVVDQVRIRQIELPSRSWLARIGEAGAGFCAAISSSIGLPPKAGLSLALLAALIPAGMLLQGDRSEPKGSLIPLSGTVSFAGGVPRAAQVVAHPVLHKLPEGTAATGIVRKDGTFKVSVDGDDSGVPPGMYVCTLAWHRWFESPQGGGLSANLLPKRYADPESSPLKVTVQEGVHAEIAPIQLSEK